MLELHERAALPIEKGGMALNNVVFISLTAFVCSLAASMRELATPDIAAQVVNFANQYHVLAPQGFFKEGDDFSAIMKTIDSVDARRFVNQRRSQLQNENCLIPSEP